MASRSITVLVVALGTAAVVATAAVCMGTRNTARMRSVPTMQSKRLPKRAHGVVVEANLVDTFTWVESSTSLPKPLSDMTATYMNGKGGSDTNGFIILFGGCDSPNGNQRDKSQSQMQFYCLSVTNSTFLYDPYQNSVTKVKDAPNPRYRHVAVSFNEEIYMLGGRDLADNFVTAIDVSNANYNCLHSDDFFVWFKEKTFHFTPFFK